MMKGCLGFQAAFFLPGLKSIIRTFGITLPLTDLNLPLTDFFLTNQQSILTFGSNHFKQLIFF
jgi:hypothetical protein